MFLQRRPVAFMPAMSDLRRELDRVFGTLRSDTLFSGMPGLQAYPPLNAWEDGHAFFVEAEVPGMCMEDIELNVVGNELTINATRKATLPEGATHLRRERFTGEFTRSIALPSVVDTSRVEATLRDGVLRVTLPKPEEAKARRITVKAG
jgi:HSP20 family protein